MPKPNTFIIGAMKAATSSLHSYLGRHPDIGMSAFKEPAFFLGPTRPSDGPALSDRYRNDEAEYLSLFDGMESLRIRGESTTDYTKRPRFEGVAARIHAFDENVRLIYLLRDPIDRTISHYWWAVRHENETREMIDAFKADPFYEQVSNYAWQLQPYLERFGPDRVLVDTTERLSQSPEAFLRRTFKWLGVDPDIPLAEGAVRHNVTPDTVVQTRSTFLQAVRHSPYLGRALTRLTPRRLRTLARSWAEREVDKAASPTLAVRRHLRSRQREQTARLSELLQRSFDEWSTLYGDD